MIPDIIYNYSQQNNFFWSKMVIVCDEKIIFEKILVSEKELSDIEIERLKNTLACIKNMILPRTCIL